jgi:hypothetical protein
VAETQVVADLMRGCLGNVVLTAIAQVVVIHKGGRVISIISRASPAKYAHVRDTAASWVFQGYSIMFR